MFSKFFSEYVLAVGAWALTALAAVTYIAGHAVGSGPMLVGSYTMFFLGSALGGIATAKGLRELRRRG